MVKHNYPKFEVGLLDDSKGVVMFLNSLLGGVTGLLNSVGGGVGGLLGTLGSFVGGLL